MLSLFPLKSIGIVRLPPRILLIHDYYLWTRGKSLFGQGSVFSFTLDHFEMKYWIGISLDKIISIYVCLLVCMYVCMHVCLFFMALICTGKGSPRVTERMFFYTL